MTSDPVATVVIPAFHRPSSLAELTAALDDPRLEIVVVNIEADPDVHAVNTSFREVALEENVGYARAVNAGVAEATTPVTIFCNDDATLTADVAIGLASIVGSGEADVVVPRIVDQSGVTERTIFSLPTPSRLAVEWLLLPDRPISWIAGRFHVEKWRAPEQRELVAAASAVVVATRTEILRGTPIPDAYFLYWEEAEWFWRLAERGYAVVYEPRLTAVHSGGRADVRASKCRLLARNAVRCVRRTQGARAAAVAFPIVLLWQGRLLAVDVVRWVLGRTPSGRVTARVAGVMAALGAIRELV